MVSLDIPAPLCCLDILQCLDKSFEAWDLSGLWKGHNDVVSFQLCPAVLECLRWHIHRLEQFSQHIVTSHHSGGWKAKIKMLAHLASLCHVSVHLTLGLTSSLCTCLLPLSS